MPDLPLVLTVEETAKALRVSRGACYELVRTGQVPSIRLGRTLRVPRAALLALLSEVGPPNERAGREQPGVPVLSERFDRRVGAEEDVR